MFLGLRILGEIPGVLGVVATEPAPFKPTVAALGVTEVFLFSALLFCLLACPLF